MSNEDFSYQLQIMRSPHGDSSNGGESSRRIWLNVVGRVDGEFVEPIPNHLRISLAMGPLFAVERVGTRDALVPVDPFDDTWIPRTSDHLVGPMCGGNVAIADADRDDPFVKWLTGASSKVGVFLKIHDRFETQETYDANFD